MKLENTRHKVSDVGFRTSIIGASVAGVLARDYRFDGRTVVHFTSDHPEAYEAAVVRSELQLDDKRTDRRKSY